MVLTDPNTIEWPLKIRWTGTLGPVLLVLALALSACGEDPTTPEPTTTPCTLPCTPEQVCDTEQGVCVTPGEDVWSDTDAGNDAEDLSSDSSDVQYDEDSEPADSSDATEDSDQNHDLPPDEDASDTTEELVDAYDGDSNEENDVADLAEVDAAALVLPAALAGCSAEPRLPQGVNFAWQRQAPEDILPGYTDDISGYRIERNGELVAELAFPDISSRPVAGIVPGEESTFSVKTFLNTAEGRLYSEPCTDSIALVEPRAIGVAPLTDIVLGSDSRDGAGQIEFLNVAFFYGSTAEPAWTTIMNQGVKEASATVTLTSDNEDSVTVSRTGMIQAFAPGQATITAEYEWDGNRLTDSVDVTVYDGVEEGRLSLSISPEPYADPEEAPEEELQAYSVQLLGPNDSVHNLPGGNTMIVRLYVGTHYLVVSHPTRGTRRHTVHIRPDSDSRVVVPFSLPPECTQIGPEGGSLVASSGASVTFPNGSLPDVTEICLATMTPAESPHRGPSEFQPLFAPTAIELLPANLELAVPATLELPVEATLASFAELSFDAVGAVFPVYRYDLIQWSAHSAAALGSDSSRNYYTLEIDELGLYSASLCPSVGETSGSCRVHYEQCISGRVATHRELEGTACGEIVTIDEDVSFLPSDVSDVDGESNVDLAAAGARSMGLHGRFTLPSVCTANPCGFGEECSAQCTATAQVQSCGRNYESTIEHWDSGWNTLRDLSVHVPVSGGCGEVYEGCTDGAVCLPNADMGCVDTCMEGE